MNRLYGSIDGTEWVHDLLDVRLVHLREKVLDPVLVFDVVKHDESLSGGRHEGGDKPLVELVHDLEVHVGSSQHLLVHQVQRSVSNELVEVPVVVLLDLPTGGGELYLEEGIVVVADYDEVVGPRHVKCDTSHSSPQLVIRFTAHSATECRTQQVVRNQYCHQSG